MNAVKPPVFLLMLLSLLAACGGSGSGSNVLPKGARLLEIHVNEPADQDFEAAFNLAQSMGMDAGSLSFDWNQIDIGTDHTTVPPSPIYADNPATDFLTIANGCYPNSHTKVSILLRPITTLTRMAPPGFESTAWDDPAMIHRFNAFLDHVFAKIPDLDITALAIGSEVDLHLLDGAVQQQYLVFYEQVSAYAREAYALLYPDKAPLLVAVEVTHQGLLIAATRSYYQQLNAYSDVVGVSYYPLNNYSVQDPGVVAGDFEQLLALYPDKNLHLFQLGYPSGYYSTQAYAEYAAGQVTPVINSSDQLQADFIEAVFDAWDAHAHRINSIGFTWMNEVTTDGVAETITNPAFGGLTDPPPDMVEFLRTLGLRTEAGEDKEAWVQLIQAAKARGWTDTGYQLICN